MAWVDPYGALAQLQGQMLAEGDRHRDLALSGKLDAAPIAKAEAHAAASAYYEAAKMLGRCAHAGKIIDAPVGPVAEGALAQNPPGPAETRPPGPVTDSAPAARRAG